MQGILAGSIAKDSPEVVVATFSFWLPGLMSHAVVPNAFHVLLYDFMISELGLMSSLRVHYLVCNPTE